MQRLDPPLSWPALPRPAARIGPEPEDFRVDELPLYEPSGTGSHLWVRLEKRSLTTPELLQRVARAAGVSERDIGSAGMKDKHAVTTQWLSLPENARAPETWNLPDGARLLEQTRHGNKLRTGHQRGNRFSIRLVAAEPDKQSTQSQILLLVEKLRAAGLPNYFGPQRFGKGGDNLDAALAWLRGAPRRDRRARFFAKLYPSVIQSEVFNRFLALRTERGLDRLLPGDVVRLSGSRSLFVVEDAEKESARLAARDVFLTGPLPGPKLLAARGEPADLEQAAIAAIGLEPSDLERLGRDAPGTRRDLVVFPEALSVTAEPEASLLLGFELPSGSYATELIRQLVGPLTR